MRTRNSYFPNNSSATIPRRQNKKRIPNIVEPELRTIVEMADNRTMEELLQAPTEGYGEAIVIPEINDDHFEIKTNLLQLVQANPYHGFERANPHTHINNFKRITSTLKFKDVPNNVIKLMMFPYSLEGNARVWYDKEPPNSILTWEDLKIITPAPVKAVEESCVTCGGNHAYYNCPNTDKSILDLGKFPSNTIPNPKGEMKAITTQSGVAYGGPSIPTPIKVVEQVTEETADKEQSNFQGSSAHIQPPVILILESDVLKTLPKPYLRYPSRLNDQKLHEKATNPMEKFFQIFQDLHFDISFVDALLLMLKFASTIKSLLINKDKLFELAKIPLNENCLAMLLKKLLENPGDPSKFLIPCDFPGMDVCHALADLSASINLIPLSIWKKLSLPELTSTRMTLELADRSITRSKGVAEDVFVKVRKFHFSTDFVVVDFEADPRVPLILGRLFLRTGHALIDVYEKEITLRVNDEAVTFNLNQTTRYSSTYDGLSVNRIDIIDVAREKYAQEILSFSSNSLGCSPTLTFEPILSDSSPSLTLFEGSDFILEEIKAYVKDDLISPEIDHAYFDQEGDICLIEKLLNDDPLQLPPMYLKEVIKAKSSIEEPSEVELKDLSSHLEYAYLEVNDKLPVIISKDLKDEEKEVLLNMLKSHKHAIAWKITDIKGIDPRFYTHRILMEEDFKPSVQSQRRVNPKFMRDSFDTYLSNLKRMLKSLEVDRAKFNVIAKLPHLTTVKGVRGFLVHAGFYRHFIQDFSKIARPMTHILEKKTSFVFSKDCIDAFETLKKKITEAPILVVPDWNLPFELMCDASDFSIGAVLGQRKMKHFQPYIMLLLELMLSKRLKKNTKCVNAVNEELTAAKHKLMLLVY
nr:reverse transcriptase domain-containing protein [Tanacetum cinerariifolium]